MRREILEVRDTADPCGAQNRSAVETLDTYRHLWPDSDDRTRDAIDSVLGFTADGLRMEAAPSS